LLVVCSVVKGELTRSSGAMAASDRAAGVALRDDTWRGAKTLEIQDHFPPEAMHARFFLAISWSIWRARSRMRRSLSPSPTGAFTPK
jgi:hypothetical protein